MKSCRNNIAQRTFIISLVCGMSLVQRRVDAVPASFLQQPSAQQADVKWARLENERFIVYYDSTQPALAEHALKSAEAAYPDYSVLLGTYLSGQPNLTGLPVSDAIESRFSKIPVIVSSRSDGASFANFVPQTIEIQSTLSPPASLFQHELAHRMMYEHLDLKVGPAGRTFMLAMLPTWWTEGLAEYLTESLGRLETEGYIRAMVLNDSFLSWDRLHALYKSSGTVAVRGYALSGRFFKYFLERTPEKDLVSLHQSLKHHQLIPPFFSGAYLLIKSLTGQWPGDLYESFKQDTRKSVLRDLGDMPRLSKLKGSVKVFDSFGGGSFIAQNETFLIPDFATKSREGGLQEFRFIDNKFTEISESRLRPLSLQVQDRIFAHPRERKNGGFWTTSLVQNKNRTYGNLISYQNIQGSLHELDDDSLKKRIDFSLNSDGSAPIVRCILPLERGTAAVLSTNNTATQLQVVDAKSNTQSFVGQWIAPERVQFVKLHETYPQTSERPCAHVIVNSDSERTSLQQRCEKMAPKVIIPAGKFLIQDALMLAPDDFVLLVGWHNIQALVRWKQGEAELIGGAPEWIEQIYSGQDKDRIFLNLYTGEKSELWSISLDSLRSTHRDWIVKKPENSKWWAPPEHVPYVPPFARYAALKRKEQNKKLHIELSRKGLLPKRKASRLFAQDFTSSPETSLPSDTPVLQYLPMPSVPPPSDAPEMNTEPQADAPLPEVQTRDEFNAIGDEAQSAADDSQADAPQPNVPAPALTPETENVSTDLGNPEQTNPAEPALEENKDAEGSQTIVDPNLPGTSTSIPAPYRFRHWMTYPNYTPSFLAGVTSLGLFSRPFVDEMERFYVQLFGSYVWDESLVQEERWGLEVNIVGNRLFDGWKSNLFLRPRLNGIAYYCRAANRSIVVCPGNRPSPSAQFTYLREYGLDFELRRKFESDEDSSILYRSRLFKISPSASNFLAPDTPLGAQDTVLGAVGAAYETTLWEKVFFDAPVTQLNKRKISARGNVRASLDTTQGLYSAKSGSGESTDRVNYQNYSLELSHTLGYRRHSVGVRNLYASTGGGTPLNRREYFTPFKTYLIGANDGLQDISTSIAGANLLSYIRFGRVQYRNSINYIFPIVGSLDTRFGPAFLERLDGEVVLSRGGVSNKYDLSQTESITTITGSMRLNIDVKGYQFYPAILYGKAIDKPLWELFTQIRFDQFW